jgi:hypothetical protein
VAGLDWTGDTYMGMAYLVGLYVYLFVLFPIDLIDLK